MKDAHIIEEMLNIREVKFTLHAEFMRVDCEIYDDKREEWYLVAQVVPDTFITDALNILLIGRDTREPHHVCLASDANDVRSMLTHYSGGDVYLPTELDDTIDSWKLIRRMSKCE